MTVYGSARVAAAAQHGALQEQALRAVGCVFALRRRLVLGRRGVPAGPDPVAPYQDGEVIVEL